jgi:hypothetical protein
MKRKVTVTVNRPAVTVRTGKGTAGAGGYGVVVYGAAVYGSSS